jgi:hypothetical protein
MRQDLMWLAQNGCELGIMLPGIFAATAGEPCRECNCKPSCPAWAKLCEEDKALARSRKLNDGRTHCPRCESPLNMRKVAQRGGKCACGQPIPAGV